MTRNDIFQTAPASVFGNRWRDATPLGNGSTGVMLYGGAAQEQIVLSCADLWYGGFDGTVPDVSDVLQEMRQLHRSGRDVEACNLMFDALNERGYQYGVASPRVLGCVKLMLGCDGVYSQYRRILHLDTAESQIDYQLNGVPFGRRCIVSRKRDVIAMRITSGKPQSISLCSGFYNSLEGGAEDILRQKDQQAAVYGVENGCYAYSTCGEGGHFGIVVKAVSNGAVHTSDTGIMVENSTETLLLIRVFSNAKNRIQAVKKAAHALQTCPESYDTLFLENRRLYARLYNSADLRLFTGRTFHSNETLLADARYGQCSAELAEKLWRFGRYLFISGTAKDGQPFPLYGLWHSGYQREWPQHVANENVQMIYWHTSVGGLTELVPALIDYFFRKMAGFRENARKLYGCSGIYISAYTSPMNSTVLPHVPVIMHFLGVAGWLCRHFYEYYLVTRDEKMLEQKILPFMLETAAFYEDYIYFDENGMIELYPAVSPENTPAQYHGIGCNTASGHPMPVTKNPTIEFAILKELLTNLIAVCEKKPDMKEKVACWTQLLTRIPEYMRNEDGAIAEWMDETVRDCYEHRHLSHVYPLFPGTEIEESGAVELIPAFQKAVDLRKLGHMTGWSLAHMAAIYARLCNGQKLFDSINMLTKVCLLENFFTLHNDFRGMGITTVDMGGEAFAPVQLDALMGTVNALQEMLLFASEKKLRLLPACPEQFPKGSAHLRFFAGDIRLQWNLPQKQGKAVITANRETEIAVELPFGGGIKQLRLKAGEKVVL